MCKLKPRRNPHLLHAHAHTLPTRTGGNKKGSSCHLGPLGLQLPPSRGWGLTNNSPQCWRLRTEVRCQQGGDNPHSGGRSQGVLTGWVSSVGPSHKGTDPIMGAPPSQPNHLPKAHLPTPSPWGQSFKVCICCLCVRESVSDTFRPQAAALENSCRI